MTAAGLLLGALLAGRGPGAAAAQTEAEAVADVAKLRDVTVAAI